MQKQLPKEQSRYSFIANREWTDMIGALVQLSERQVETAAVLSQDQAVPSERQLLSSYLRMLAVDLLKLNEQTRCLEYHPHLPGYIAPYLLQQQARITEQGNQVIECFLCMETGKQPLSEARQELIRLDSHLLDYQLIVEKLLKA